MLLIVKNSRNSHYIYSSDTEKLIIALLKYDEDVAAQLLDEGQIDPQKLLQLSNRHMILPMILHNLSTLKIKNKTRDEILSNQGDQITRAAALHIQLRYELKLVSDILKKEGIDFMLIKGFALDKSPMRQMSDIDLLIEEEDLTLVFTALKESGYRYIGSGVMSQREINEPFKTLHWNNQFQFKSPISPVHIEIHINLFERDRIRLEKLDSLLAKTDLFRENRVWDEELKCYIPSKEASLALLCVHSTTKRSPAHNTYIMRHGYNLASLIKSGIDMERFLQLCSEWKIEYYAYTAFRLTAMILNENKIIEPVAPLEKELTKRQKHLSDVHINCFKGLGDASLLQRKRYALHMPGAIGGKFRKTLTWYRQQLFPPLYSQESRFGVSKESPAIFFTYVYGPVLHAFRLLERKMHKC